VFFCGDQARDELPAMLVKHNIAIEKVVVYKTILQPKKVEPDYDGILFFSPTAVESFFSSNSTLPGTVLFAIGETTASSLRKASNNEIIVSDHSSEEWMIKKLQERFLVRE
jgi:uroporphyrinogen-III synthase